MSDAIQPALTPEQWAGYPKVYFRKPRGGDGGYGIALESPTNAVSVWDDSWGVLIEHENRHAAAAVLLHGMPFGFTHDEVRLVRLLGRALEKSGCSDNEYLGPLADKIAALLPPAP